MTRLKVGILLAAVFLPFVASAQDVGDEPVLSRGQGWSLFSGQTVGNNANVISGQVLWPGLSAQFTHGATDKFDIGARLTLINYAFEGRVRDLVPGMKLQAVTRFGLLQKGKLNLGAEFAPGLMLYFPGGRSQFGLALPLRLTAGIPIGAAMMVNFGMDLPMFVVFGTRGETGFHLPILFGGGLEYFIDRRLSASFNIKMGPSIYTRFGTAEFAMDALFGVAYRF